MNFGDALVQLKDGKKLTLRGWGGAYIQLYNPDDTDIVTIPYIYMVLEVGEKMVWNPTPMELLCDDWFIYKDLDSYIEGDEYDLSN